MLLLNAELVRDKQMNHEPFSRRDPGRGCPNRLVARFTDRWNTRAHHFPLSCVGMPPHRTYRGSR